MSCDEELKGAGAASATVLGCLRPTGMLIVTGMPDLLRKRRGLDCATVPRCVLVSLDPSFLFVRVECVQADTCWISAADGVVD